ncbi:MAG: DUF6063 family protein [Bacillota bacterium]
MDNASSFPLGLKLYKRLLEEGMIDLETDSIYAKDYYEEGVKDLVYDIAENMDTSLIEVSNKLYLVPHLGNTFLIYSNQELLKDIVLGKYFDIPHLYLAYYVAITIFCEFYSAENYFRHTKSFVLVGDIVKTITDRLKELNENEDIERIETEYQFNIKALYERWIKLDTYKEDKDDKKQKSQVRFITKVVEFFSKQDILELRENDTEVRPTERLHAIMKHYYAEPGREAAILSLVRGV